VGNVVYLLNVSLDGFVEDSAGTLGWANVDHELHTYFNERARATGAFLYGRRMWELMSSAWPTADEQPGVTAAEAEFAAIWRPKPKVVFSRTLEEAEWNTRIIRADLPGAIAELKAEFDGVLGVGGPGIAGSLMRLGLVDGWELVVHPVVLGGGKPFWPDGGPREQLALFETRTFGSGAVLLRYGRRSG
jgi:dihydrofolate reductase